MRTSDADGRRWRPTAERTGSHFENSTLVDAFLHNAIAHRVLFDGADLRRTCLAGADRSGSWFRGAVLAGADLEGRPARVTSWPPFQS
ncbi:MULTISPECIES: pentapeptide repeat-containing protein [unclassified Streptomyces]|uniref:pentapeptide repeat-containing protein n=1 Tax=unclassified Streptomyces TaxID=2593676 RepID=UPI00338F58CC